MLRVGLTGGIASGKSAAARSFAELGVVVIDADAIAHELVAPGSPLLTRIIDAFGSQYRLADGGLDREALGKRVFSDPEQRYRLEQLTHPAIRAEMLARVTTAEPAAYVVLMVPLLIETGMTDLVDRVLVVDTDEQRQRERLATRDNLPAERIDQILAAQASREQRLAQADDVIDNTGDLGMLRKQVTACHRNYLAMAAKS